MLSGKVDLFYEINPVVSPSIMWFCDMMKSSIDSSRRYFTPEKPLISNNVVKKISSQASSNGFGSLNLLVNIFGDGFVAEKIVIGN